MAYTLNMLKKGEACTVVKVNGKGALKKRLFDMGITPGVVIILKKTAPFGDPIEIDLRGYSLSIRKSEAKEIEVEKIEIGK
ncbi:MAG: ferrous iron transport protein A [Lachnospiraceae bacterium]|nr:ferrous iron transport protein A [Lachnospiraceae bacterium]